MLTREERADQEAFVSDVLYLFTRRKDDVMTICATIGPMLERLELGVTSVSNVVARMPLTPSQQWSAAVWLILKMYIKRDATYVLCARLLRRKKSHESSWGQIAAELETSEAHVKRMFRDTVPVLCALLEAENITVKSSSAIAA